MTRNKSIMLMALSLALPLIIGAAQAADLPEQCSKAPERGECKALFESAYYDQSAKKCRTYFNDGCGPVVPFETLEECLTLCETVPELRLTEMRKVDATPIVSIKLEYPNIWHQTPKFIVRAGDKVLQTRPPVIRWQGERIHADLDAVLDFTHTGELSIEAMMGGQIRRVFETVHWAPQTVVKLLNHSGIEEGISGDEDLRFLVYGSKTPVFRLNGVDFPGERIGTTAGSGVLWRVSPSWGPSLNTLSVESQALDGGAYNRTFTFLNLGQGDITLGRKVSFQCGYPGGRGGPMFDAVITGKAVNLEGRPSEGVVDAVDSEGWPLKATVYNCIFAAVAPGKSTLTINQSFFHQPEPEAWRTFQISVSERAGQ